MDIRLKWFIAAGTLTVGALALLAQEPGGRGGSGFGAFGGSGRGGRGGGGGAFFVTTPVFETEPPVLPADLKSGGVLIYSKTNGFRDESAIQASNAALAAIAH